MRMKWLYVIAVAALLVSTDAHAESCKGNCLDDDRNDQYYCQNPDLCLKRHYEQKQHCETSVFLPEGCTGTSQPDPDALDYTDYDGYAVTSGDAGWYCVVNGDVIYCPNGQGQPPCENGQHCVYFNGTDCACVTWGTGTPHKGLIYCLW